MNNSGLIILMILIYRYMSYKEYQGELDPLTGVMGRGLFLHYCAKIQTNVPKGKQGWFLFLDLDWFKQINDTLGHGVGDYVLKQVGQLLQRIFGEYGAVGRVGGDEFAVMIEQTMTRQQLEQQLTDFLSAASQILKERQISCSIGVCRFSFPKEVHKLLDESDVLLYQVKERGKAKFMIQEENELLYQEKSGGSGGI